MKASNIAMTPLEFLWKFALVLLVVVPIYIGGCAYFLYFLVGFTPWDSLIMRAVGTIIGAIVGTIGSIMATTYIIKFGHKEG
jgi:hypothetical protein